MSPFSYSSDKLLTQVKILIILINALERVQMGH